MESKPNNINFISNGLLFASSILFAAFSYSEKGKIRTDLEKAKSTIIKYQTIKKDEPRKIKEVKKRKQTQTKNKTKKSIDLKSHPTHKIKVTKNNPDSSSTVNTLPQPIDFDSVVIYKVVDIKPDVVDFPDQDAKFKGEAGAMTKFIIHHLDIYKMDLSEAQNIVVHVEFVIDDEGKVTLISFKGDYHKSIESEIKRMIYSMPSWIPGEHKGRKVHTRMYLPIRIDLQ